MTHASLSRLLSAALLLCIGAGLAATLVGFASHASNWGELTTPALLVAGLVAFGLGSLVFAPRRR